MRDCERANVSSKCRKVDVNACRVSIDGIMSRTDLVEERW